MTKSILLLLSAAAMFAATPDAKTEKEIMSAMETYRQGLLKRDAAMLDKVLSEDLVYTHSSNAHQNKAEVIAALKGTTYQDAIEFKDLKVKVYGNTAVVVGDIDFHNAATGGNPAVVNKLNVLHVFVKGPQGWQMVARQATKYPDAAPTAAKK
jgi:ketosteroid isomerase-like protein